MLSILMYKLMFVSSISKRGFAHSALPEALAESIGTTLIFAIDPTWWNNIPGNSRHPVAGLRS